jgi:hypothetical protein
MTAAKGNATRATIVTLLCLLGPAHETLAEDSPDKAPKTLAHLRWQHHALDVLAVYVGPDGKLWSQLSADPGPRTQDDIKRSLEHEYRQPAPRIAGAQVALIQPDGRAWFYLDFGRKLCGYDGQRWIEVDYPVDNHVCGNCPTRGQLLSTWSNRWADGKAWFLTRRGVSIYDGEKWIHQIMDETLKPGTPNQARLVMSPSGKLAAVLVGQAFDLWVYEDGAWHHRGKLNELSGSSQHTNFCLTDAGILWYLRDGVALRWHRAGANARPEPDADAPELARLIEQLGADDFKVRESATEKLASRGAEIKPQLEAALAAATNAEIKQRLKQILMKAAIARPAKSIVTRFGELEVSQPAAVMQDDQGRLLVAAEAVRKPGEEFQPGLVIRGPDGQMQVLRGEGIVAPWRPYFRHRFAPVLADDAKSLWLAAAESGRPAVRLDLASGQFTEELPDARFGWVNAIDAQGRVFASRLPPFAINNAYGGALMVYTPGAPDPRKLLTATTLDVLSPQVLVDSEGCVWANRQGQGLVRFDGREWEVIHPAADDVPTPLLVGGEGVMLAKGRKDYHLFRSGKQVATGELKTIAQDQRELLIKAFSHQRHQPNTLPPHWQSVRTRIVADAAGDLWVQSGEHIFVLVGEQWLDATPALQAEGVLTVMIRAPAAVGNGSKIYLSDQRPVQDRGKSVLASIVDGQLQLEPAPHFSRDPSLATDIRDPEGGLWIAQDSAAATSPTRSAGMTSVIYGQRVLRLTDAGPLDDYKNAGWPILADHAGCIWLGRIYDQPTNRFNIWRRKLVQELEIPGTDWVPHVVSDKPGSVYAWSSRGLEHLVAEEHPVFRYVLDATYAIPSLPPLVLFTSASQHGYLVFVTATNEPSRRQVHLIRLPE